MDLYMEKSWAKLLDEELKKDYMNKLRKFLLLELKNKQIIYPPQDLIFNAFCQTSFENVKVLVIGQDPYHGRGQAHGLSYRQTAVRE